MASSQSPPSPASRSVLTLRMPSAPRAARESPQEHHHRHPGVVDPVELARRHSVHNVKTELGKRMSSSREVIDSEGVWLPKRKMARSLQDGVSNTDDAAAVMRQRGKSVSVASQVSSPCGLDANQRVEKVVVVARGMMQTSTPSRPRRPTKRHPSSTMTGNEGSIRLELAYGILLPTSLGFHHLPSSPQR